MSTTQSIILYRNPAEAAFWEGGYLIPLIGGLGAGVIVFLLILALAGKLSRDWRGPNDYVMWGAALVALGAGVQVFNYLFI